jgi:hypothetical protein
MEETENARVLLVYPQMPGSNSREGPPDEEHSVKTTELASSRAIIKRKLT